MYSIGIVVPSWHYFANPFKLQPLNELYFATVIESRFQSDKVKVQVIDLRPTRLQKKAFAEETTIYPIPEQDLYIYWITKTADYPELVSIVKKIRSIYPKAIHAAGGTHIQNFPDEGRQVFDAIVLGPGEESFISIILDGMNGILRKEYSTEWKDVRYSEYPFALRHYLPETSIINNELFEKYDGVLGTSAMFSRGCNFNCAYCVYNIPHSIQRRTPTSVEDEIMYLIKEYKIQGVNLRDEICIPLSREHAIPFIEAIARCNVIWRGQTRIGTDRDILKLARESGCVELALGVESVSQRALDIVKKKQSVKQARDFIALCKSLNIKVKMCLILGLPGEPQDIVDMTKTFIDDTKPDYVNVSGFCPVPGSDIFQNFRRYGIKSIDKDWNRHAHLLFRFSDEEDFGLPFEYEKTGEWGANFSRSQIIHNIKEIQHYLRENRLCY